MAAIYTPVKNYGCGACKTKRREMECSFTWTIDNFSQFDENKFKSPSFTSAVEDLRDVLNPEWRIYLRPENDAGERTENYTRLSLWLYSLNRIDEAAFTEATFSILDDGRNAKCVKKVSVCVRDVENTVLRCIDFVRKDHLFRNRSLLLPNDKLTVRLDLTVTALTYSTEEKPLELQEDLGLTLFNKPKFCDVTLCAAGGTEIKAHKSVLASKSLLFETLCEQDKIDMEVVDPQVVQEMLRFIYTGQVLNLDKMALKLYVISEEYKLEKLKDRCRRHLVSNLAVNIAADILILADKHSDTELKNRVLGFIAQNGNEFVNTERFESMSESHPHLTKELFIQTATNTTRKMEHH